MSRRERDAASSLPHWTAFGAGKVILLGEHAVVYGEPALAAPLSVGVHAHGVPSKRCELSPLDEVKGARRTQLLEAFGRAAERVGSPGVRVTLRSELPLSNGLGSSAAVSVACARLLLQAAGEGASSARVAQLAQEMESVFHGQPSGVDHTTSIEGRLIRFARKPGAPTGRARRIRSPKTLQLVVALAGARGPTKETVRGLRQRTERWPDRYQRLFREIGKVVEEGTAAVEAGELEALGDAMNVNHGLLAALGLSSVALDETVHALRDAGALGAKLTGAGGSGGAVVGLFLHPAPAVAKLTRAGISCFLSPVEATVTR